MYLLHMLRCNYGSRSPALASPQQFFMIKHFLNSKQRGKVKMKRRQTVINFHVRIVQRKARKTKWKNRSSFKLNRSFIIISSFHAECFALIRCELRPQSFITILPTCSLFLRLLIFILIDTETKAEKREFNDFSLKAFRWKRKN